MTLINNDIVFNYTISIVQDCTLICFQGEDDGKKKLEGASIILSPTHPGQVGGWQNSILELNIEFFHLDLLCNNCYLPSSSAQVILVRYVDDWHNSILAFNIVFFIILSNNDLYDEDNQTWPILIGRQQSHKHLYFMS